MKFRSFRGRIVFFFLALLTLVQVIAFVVVNAANTRNARGKIASDLVGAGQALERLIHTRTERLAEAARLLSGDYAFKAAYATGDAATITSALENQQARIGADVMVVTSQDHEVMAHTLPRVKQIAGQPFSMLLEAAERSGGTSGVTFIGTRLYQIVIVPVLAPMPVAWLGTGFVVDDKLAQDLQKAVQTHVSLLTTAGKGAWTVIGSTLPPTIRSELPLRLSPGLPAKAESFSIRGGEEEYVTLVVPFGDVRDGSVVAVLQNSVEQALQPFYRLRTTLTLLLASGLVVSLIAGVLVGRSVTRPVQVVVAGVRRIAHGEYGHRIRLEQKDELGELANAINAMAGSLEAQRAALERKIAETTTLYEIGQEISAEVALEPLFRRITERARDFLHAECAVLALPESGGWFGVAAAAATAPEMADALKELKFKTGEGFAGAVVSTGRPLVVRDFPKEFRDSPLLDMILRANVRSLVAVPLRARGSTLGVLIVTSSATEAFSDDARQLLDALGDHAAVVIENATLYAQERQHAEDLEGKVELRTRQLQDANRELERASAHKSEFLATMSHELRTPLNAIIGFTRLVSRHSQGVLPDRQLENLGKILRSSEDLLELINTILDLSKIEAGRMEVSVEPVDVEELVIDCVRSVEHGTRSDRLQLVTEVEPDLPRITSDYGKLKQILLNLLSNALKFTDAGTVTVTAQQRDGVIALAVADTGIGIASEELALVFEKFRQGDSSTTRRYGGTGLGLPISRQLARLLGGDVTDESKLGRGSTFRLTIPTEYRAPQTALSRHEPTAARG